MKTYPTLKEAQEAQDAGEVFLQIHRVTDTEWVAYEPGDEAQMAQDLGEG